MAEKKKAGRPLGSQNKVGKDQKEFIKGLLGETQEEFRDAFLYYAKSSSSNIESRSKFVNLSIELSKMIVPKPIEADVTVNESNFKKLMGLCAQWDDEV